MKMTQEIKYSGTGGMVSHFEPKDVKLALHLNIQCLNPRNISDK